MKSSFRAALVFFSVLLSVNFSFCVDIGSDSAVTRFDTQQEVNNGDRIAGFAALEAGFEFANPDVSGTFDSFFEVSGGVSLNCGTLILERDLIFRDVAEFTTLGTIIGNMHTVEFSSTITKVPFVGFSDGEEVICECEFGHIQTLDPADADKINTVDWSSDNNYVAAGLKVDANLATVRIYELVGGALVSRFSSDLDIDDEIVMVQWHPDENKHLLAVARKKGIDDEVLIFEFNTGTYALTEKGQINLGDIDAKGVSWSPSGNYIAVSSKVVGAELAIYSVSATGVITTPAVVSVSTPEPRDEAIDWAPSGTQIVIGTKDAAGGIQIYDFDDSTPGSETLTLNVQITDFDSQTNSVDWNNTYSEFIAVGIDEDTTDSIFVFQHEGATNYLSEVSSVAGATPKTLFVHWSHEGECLAVGSDISDGSSGIEEFQTFKFDLDDYSLTTKSQDDIGEKVKAISWSPDDEYIVIGTEGDNDEIRLYEVCPITECQEGECICFEDLEIFLNNDLLLGECNITFTGDLLINGRGNCLTLSSSCTIWLDSNASVLFKDLTLKGIDDERFYCVDDSATMSFHDVEIILDNDFTFSLGKFEVLADLSIVGEDCTFAYQSSEVSTIEKYGRFFVENKVTFSYDPPIASRELIHLAQETSEFILNGGTLHSTSTGLKLTSGRLIIDRNSALSSEGSVEDEAIDLHGVYMQTLPAGNVNFVGTIAYE